MVAVGDVKVQDLFRNADKLGLIKAFNFDIELVRLSSRLRIGGGDDKCAALERLLETRKYLTAPVSSLSAICDLCPEPG